MKEDKKVPQLRFPEFTDAWKQRKVKELCSISTGKSNTQDKVDDGEYPFYVRSPIVERSKKYLYDEEAVLTVGDGVGTGKVFHYVNGKYDLHQRCYRMFNFSEELNAKYFYHIFSKMFYKRVMSMTAKTSVDSVRMDMIADMEIPVPNIKEQEKIGAFFSDIDNLITLQQRKLNSLQKLQKRLLQKMFPKKGENITEIRFPEFSDAWKQRELGEIAEKVTKKNSNLEISETFTNSAEQGIISQKDFFDHKVASSENIGNYYVVDKNDFVYNPRISTTAPVGPINRNRLGRAGVMSPLYTVFRAKDINQLFLEWYFKSSCWHLFMYFNGDSGARSDRFSIKDSVFFSMPIFVPSKEEQFKIGRFFDQLNETITLQQRKLESLQKLKKGLLQQMFI